MIGLLKGYYGYKNFGDEVLLLGVIPYLFSHYGLKKLYIESEDVERLNTRLARHSDLIGSYLLSITVIEKHTAMNYSRDELFLGGGEVLTDGRPFPYNGRNYLLVYRKTIFRGKYHLFGGVGTPKRRSSRLLRSFLIKKAKTVVVREKRSYDVVCKYRTPKKTVLYHDFAEDVLPVYIKKASPSSKLSTALLNVNPYIRSQETKQKLITYAQSYSSLLYFPAEIGVDDAFFANLAEDIEGLSLYDRTKYDLTHICLDISSCAGVMAARLHVLRLAKLLNISFEPLVYQEKISTFLDQCSGE